MEDSSAPPRQQQNYRSQASNNWRVADRSPRVEPQARTPQRNSQQSNPGTPSEAAAPGSRLYVGNLLYTAQPKDVEQFFNDNGFTAVNVTMSVDPFTGRNPSYCFVDFASPEEASGAMDQLNGHDVLGRPVKINPGVAKRSGEGASTARAKNWEGGWGRRETGSPHENLRPSSDRLSRNDAATQEQGTRIYVGGLPHIEPQATVDAEMQKLFEGLELKSVSKLISPHPSKAEEPGDHHYLFIDLLSTQDVDSAIENFNGVESAWGGQLRVSRAKDNRDRKVVREQGNSGSGSKNFGSFWRRGPPDE